MKKLILASVAALALCASGAMADDIKVAKKGTIKLDVRLTAVVPYESGDIKVGPAGVTPLALPLGTDTGLNVDVNNSYVPTIGIEYYLTDNVSVEAIAGTANHNVVVPGVKGALDALLGLQIGSDKVAELWHLPPTVTAKYHFPTTGKFTPYVGAGVTYIWFYSEKKVNGIDVDLKDGFGYAAQAGFDYALQGPWSLNFDVKKIFFETDANVNSGLFTSKVTLDPVVASVGFGYKF